jgi:lysophospholipase L1-like esterase
MAKTADDPGDSKGQIDTTTDTPFTFSGMPNVSIPAGQTAWSDPLDFPLEEIKLTAITVQFGANVPSAITGHPGARTTSYVQTGDAVATEGVSGETRDRWYFIDSIEVMAPTNAYAIAILGDSISDGYGVLNQFGRWPDFMTSKIKSDPAIATTRSVLNFGMGANELTRSSQYQDAGVERFRRDVLSRDKIRWLIVLEGINDINNGIGADAITSTYEDIISEAQQAGILVYLSPLTPDGDTGTRAQVNTWIRGTGASLYDAMIDLETPISDGSNSIAQQYKRSDGDNLHPDVSGYQAMGESVDLSLFYDTTLQ